MNGNITAIILTKNEELNIERCIRSLGDLPERIVVVDSGSTDRTREIASGLGAEVYDHPFKNYAAQFNWALERTDIRTAWVYRIDADEAITPELEKEIRRECQKHQKDQVNGFLMKHKLFFMGRYLKHGGAYPFVKMTVFKPEYARFEEREMGEHVVLRQGSYLQFQNDCLHYDCKNLTAFVEKHNAYATREVKDHEMRQKGTPEKRAALYRKARKTEKLRDGFYYRLPKFVRAKGYFWYRYYIQMGFLDGKAGKIYAMIQSYFYRYLVDAKLYEKELEEKAAEKKSKEF